MELKTESMKNMKNVVAKCLDELMAKNDLSPAETKAAIDGLHLYDELCCRIEDCEAEEKKPEQDMMYSERSYSMHGDPYREYHITSYGMPERAVYSDRRYGNMNRGSNMSRGMGYSQTPEYGVHGWYQSNNYPMSMERYSGYPGYPSEHMNASYCEPYYYGSEYSDRGRGYSRHSISDRAVASLEKLFDVAASDYEKQELKKYISLVRAAGMSD